MADSSSKNRLLLAIKPGGDMNKKFNGNDNINIDKIIELIARNNTTSNNNNKTFNDKMNRLVDHILITNYGSNGIKKQRFSNLLKLIHRIGNNKSKTNNLNPSNIENYKTMYSNTSKIALANLIRNIKSMRDMKNYIFANTLTQNLAYANDTNNQIKTKKLQHISDLLAMINELQIVNTNYLYNFSKNTKLNDKNQNITNRLKKLKGEMINVINENVIGNNKIPLIEALKELKTTRLSLVKLLAIMILCCKYKPANASGVSSANVGVTVGANERNRSFNTFNEQFKRLHNSVVKNMNKQVPVE